MAEEAAPAGPSPGYFGLTVLTAVACVLAAYVFAGAPGLWSSPLSAIVPKIDPVQGWLPAVHFVFSAAMILGGYWFAGVLRTMPQPGLIPLGIFAALQFGLLATALTNLSIAVAALRSGGDVPAGLAFLAIGLVALRVHPDLYMAVLRHTSWVRSFQVSGLSPVLGSVLVALTAASNLVPLALTFQTLTTHSGAMLATLFRRASIDPQMYLAGVLNQTLTVTQTELSLAALAAAASVGLAIVWGLTRVAAGRRQSQAARIAQSLSAAQLRFIDDALPAAADAVNARASASRFVLWSVFWMFVVTPALLLTAYAAAMWFDVLQEQHALSWITVAQSDFRPFASGSVGYAQYLIPAALALIALTMSTPFARTLFAGARYDQFAFGQPMMDALRAKLTKDVHAGVFGPGQPFDAAAFAARATQQRYWVRLPLVLTALAAAALSGFWDVARGVAFTSEGVIVQEHYFAPPQFVRYYEIQAIALDCRVSPRGVRPVYELSLPSGRTIDMVGAAPLPDRLDQYLATDRRLQFSGVGYAYPPGNMEPCLTGIQKQYNSVIAAGTARLLHVLD